MKDLSSIIFFFFNKKDLTKPESDCTILPIFSNQKHLVNYNYKIYYKIYSTIDVN